MVSPVLAAELVVDLLRSAWIVERGRESVYRRWSDKEPAFSASGARAAARARILEAALQEKNRAPDVALVEPHADWIRSLAGGPAPDVAFADLLLARLGDWAEAHAAGYLGDERAERFRALGQEERAGLQFPSELPPAPPFEPLEAPDIDLSVEVRLRFGILGDLHIGSPGGEVMARAAVGDLNSSGAEFVVQLGDLTDHGNEDEFELAAGVLGGLDVPYLTMMGNHDVVSGKEERLSGPEYYPAWFGRQPDGVLLEPKGIRVAVLDSAEISASPFAPFSLMTGTFIEGPRGAVVRGSLTPPQHDILAEVGAPGAPPAFLLLHHPPQPYTGFPPVLFGLRDEDSRRLEATCASGNVWGVFAGHTHRNARSRTFGRVPAHEVAIPRDFPFGYALVDVVEEGYCYRFLQISDHELLSHAYERAGVIQRRYALGSKHDRAFVWRKA